jgi:hypothetical protein
MTPSTTPSVILTSDWVALADPNWRAAMEEEYGALMSNVITGKWIFTNKVLSDEMFDRYKAC